MKNITFLAFVFLPYALIALAEPATPPSNARVSIGQAIGGDMQNASSATGTGIYVIETLPQIPRGPVVVAVNEDGALVYRPGFACTQSEAADVVKAMKILLEIASPTEMVVENAVYLSPAARVRAYADKLAQQEKDIAWARTILAKWEERAK